MTVAVAVKVYDEIVLAADSATTFAVLDPDGNQIDKQVFNNANKVFQLHRSKPLGALTWGQGSIGPASIATLAKDFRHRIMGKDPDHKWELSDDYTVEQVVERFVEMMNGELYDGLPAAEKSVLGFNRRVRRVRTRGVDDPTG